MQIHVHYWNQLRQARGVNDESVHLESGATLLDLLNQLGESKELQAWLFDETGQVVPWILIDRGGEMVRDVGLPLSEGDQVRLSTHISGG